MKTQFLRFTLLMGMAIPLTFGQNSQTRIVGNVTDATGAAIPNAAVSATDTKTGQERKTVADGMGYYVISNLAPSVYTVKAQGNGLGPAEFSDVNVSVGQERNL